MTMNASKIKGASFPILYKFIKAASADTDTRALMTDFFNILKTEVDFDIGAYLVDYKSHIEGRIHTRFGLGQSKVDDFSRAFLNRASIFCPGLSEDRMQDIGVSILMDRRVRSEISDSWNDASFYSLEFPLLYRGEPSGIIVLGSYRGHKPFLDTCIIGEMVQHINGVLERILSHVFEEEKRLTDILFSMNEGVYIIDKNGFFTTVNPKGLELISAFCDLDMECITKSDRSLIQECECEFAKLLGRVKDFGYELDKRFHSTEIRNKNGRVLVLSICNLTTEDNWKYGYVITAKDVTEERLIQKRILLSSKLASLGEMVAGIAHEINNPLQSMLLNIELLEGNINETGRKNLDRLKDGMLRIKGTVNDLLIFAREKTIETENADINTLIEKSVDILRHQLKVSDVGVKLELDPKPLIVKCNRNLFQQVIINLLQNAKDAIEESGKGSMVNIRSALLTGKEAVVTVSDDGPGISDEIVEKIFGPFFTTKDVGKGTGLGLSVSRKIIENMGGNISVSSSPQRGSIFRITIPHRGLAIDERRKDRHREPDCLRLVSKSVLIIDDEKEVLNAIMEVVSANVPKIETIFDSKDALEKIKCCDYDFIFLDIKMPGMDGMELYGKIKEYKPYLAERIVFITGDTETKKTAEFLKLTGCRYLAKPFGIQDLLGAMCEISNKAEFDAKKRN